MNIRIIEYYSWFCTPFILIRGGDISLFFFNIWGFLNMGDPQVTNDLDDLGYPQD